MPIDGPSTVVTAALRASRTRVGAIVTGIAVPTLVTIPIDRWAASQPFRPGLIYVAVVIALAAIVGLLCGIVAAAASTVLLWYFAYTPQHSFTERSSDEALSLVIAVACLVIVLVVVWRLELARRHALQARAESASAERREAELLVVARALGAAEDRNGVRDALATAVAPAAGASSAAVLETVAGSPVYDLASGYADRVDHDWELAIADGSPAQLAADTGEPVFLEDSAAFAARWPRLAAAATAVGDQARAALPLRLLGDTRGAITLGYSTAQEFTNEDRRFLETMAELVATTLRRIDAVSRSEEDRLVLAFDTMLHGVGLYRAIRDPGGQIVDFEVRYLNREAVLDVADPASYVGGSFLDAFPRAREVGLFDELVHVLETGKSFAQDPWYYANEDGELVPLTVHVTRASTDEVLVVIQDVRAREADRQAREKALVREAPARAVIERLEQALLPEELPQVPHHRLDALYRPAARDPGVGGDWYDAIVLPTGELGLVVGDVAGHGIDATATMVFASSVLRALLTEGCEPGEALRRLDHIVAAHAGFVTCWVARYDPTRGVARVASAGHPPAVLVTRSSATLITAPLRPPLGTGHDVHTESAEIVLPSPGLVVAYTDGLVERRDASLDKGFGRLTASLASAIEDAIDPAWLDDLCDRLLEDRLSDDDICVLALSRLRGG